MSLWETRGAHFSDFLIVISEQQTAETDKTQGEGGLTPRKLVSKFCFWMEGTIHNNSRIQQAKQIESNRSPTFRRSAKPNICLAFDPPVPFPGDLSVGSS